MFKLKNKFARVLVCLLITLLIGAVWFYVSLPAINLQSQDFYSFGAGLCIIYIVLSLIFSVGNGVSGLGDYFRRIKSDCKLPAILLIAFVVFPFIAGIFSWQVFRAGAYRDLITVTDGNFSDDVAEISFDKIPMLDKDSAERLGDRKLGELSDMVSQFEVADDYSQINFDDRPVRVTPLEYGDLIKWFTNRSNGLPSYLIIDMATQDVEVVRLPAGQGIKYSESEHFGRLLYRHIRMNYPTFIFAEPTFEIDENKTPYWICPRIVKTIGLFGGTDIRGAVLVNAQTGECEYYEDVPTWVDRVYSADLIIQQYDYHGSYVNGFINSVFGQKDVTVTTSGYNYIAFDDDVYLYTGITSVGGDQSNVGFILSNQRTKETKYYPVAGATEISAMNSAEGVVQHLKYKATFPILLNIADEPTYFVSLKDNAELVKMYAMVNVRQYQLVATGQTLSECESEYAKLLSHNGLGTDEKISVNEKSGIITDIRSAVIDGNSWYYIQINNEDAYYTISAAEYKNIVTLNPGDEISIIFEASEDKLKKIVSME